MADVFGQELRDQLAQARVELAAARAAQDEDGVEAYRGRITGLLRIAARHGVDLPHTAEEEAGDD
ncbi:hypothetical protein [Kitasatospora sp. MAP5-34]|uniref:hypothetical protein n=1 Tax=Kitasatospora sp. MAP5-34 TaxID=3035102 RepID=UPI00247639A3|nr:hypothetical protein [Kitasatospora sp. MAP5-34]MDH6579463.1 hypothetical protein [Kitasatospora sp. MAP5-34]